MSFYLTEKNGVSYFRSDTIACPHGFSTRLGGISTSDATASLNLAFGRGDDRETVLENLRRFAGAVGVKPESVVSRGQIHSAKVCYVDGSNAGEGYFTDSDISCDGYVTDKAGVTLGIKTADCVPILLYEPSGIIAALHAGWRGTAARIVTVGIAQMVKLGANPKRIHGAVGTSICFDCYEVGDDFYEAVVTQLGYLLTDRYVRYVDGKRHADLPGLNEAILKESGVTQIDVSPHCTCHVPSLFYSHRASKGHRGTMLSVIALPPV